MQTHLITTEAELVTLKDSWNDLVRRNRETNLPFYSWDWFHAGWLHFAEPNGEQLAVAAVRDDSRLIGLLPLVTGKRKSAGISYRTLEFCNTAISPRNTAYFDADHDSRAIFQAILDFLLTQHRHWDMLELAQVSEATAFHRFLAEENTLRDLARIRRRGFIAPYIELGETLDDYFASLGRGTRRDLRRRLGKFKGFGEAREVRFYRQPEEMTQALDLLFAVHRKSWKGEFRNPHTPQFYRDVAPTLATRGELIVPIALIEGTPISAGFGLATDTTFFSLINDHDSRYRDLAPGLMLFIHELDFLLQTGRRIFDFCGTVYDYKEKLAEGRDCHSTFQFFHRGLKSRFLFSAKTRWLPGLRKFLGKPEPDDFIEAGTYS